MAGKENRRVQMTRLLLRTALLELMQEKTLSQITIRELCEKADLNRTTFYLHYTDQSDLLAHIEKDVIQETKTYMKDIHTDRNTIRLITAFLEYIRKNDLVFRTLFCRNESESFRRQFVEEIRQLIGMDLPAYGTERRTRYVLSFLMYGSLYVIIEWIQNNYRETAEQVARLLLEINSGVDENLTLDM